MAPAIKPFADRLLSWWDQHGRKDLPWQQPRSPYRVWVSEIMLQQTQVSTVIPYFERFMARFADIAALAAAPADDVLGLWTGLGYYARARNLHKAAQTVVAEHGGVLPSDAIALQALPGIGESTANAIVSQAHDVPAVVLDGNVRRVMARHAAIEGWVGRTAVARKLWDAAEQRLALTRAADYTQAIMDLGATLCTRSQPDCDACPVRSDCVALATERVAELPSPRPRLKIQEMTLHLLLMTQDNGKVWLQRRPDSGIWGGLWSLPEADSGDMLAKDFGLKAQSLAPLPAISHRLTHRLMHINTYRARVADETIASPQSGSKSRSQPQSGSQSGLQTRSKTPPNTPPGRWFSSKEWPELGLPKPVLGILTDQEQGDRA